MNKRTKNIVILLIVLILAAGAYFIASALNPDEEDTTDTTVNLFTCDADSISKIEYNYENETVTLIKNDDKWEYEQDSSFPLDTSAVNSMLEAISCVDITTNIGVQEDISKYGLENPNNVITATYDDKTVTFSIGQSNSTTGSTYIMKSGDENIYLTSSSIISSCNYKLMQLAAAGELPSEISGATPVSLEIQKAQTRYYMSTPISDLSSYYSGYSWQALTPTGTIIANTNTITSAISDINGLDLTSLVFYNVTGEELSSLGFDDAAKIIYTYTYNAADDDIETEDIRQDTFTFSLVKLENSTLYYIHVDGDSCVYTISEYAVQSLMNIDDTTLALDELFVLDYDTVDGMTVTYNDKTYEISLARTTSDTGDTEVSATIDGKKVGSAYVEGFFEDLLALERDSSQKGDTSQSPKLKIIFHRNTNDEYSDMTLTITPYDSSFAKVDFSGISDGLINIRDVDALIESFNSLLSQAK